MGVKLGISSKGRTYIKGICKYDAEEKHSNRRVKISA
jgi:hypothetical protein